jgi:hypothetical protein
MESLTIYSSGVQRASRTAGHRAGCVVCNHCCEGFIGEVLSLRHHNNMRGARCFRWGERSPLRALEGNQSPSPAAWATRRLRPTRSYMHDSESWIAVPHSGHTPLMLPRRSYSQTLHRGGSCAARLRRLRKSRPTRTQAAATGGKQRCPKVRSVHADTILVLGKLRITTDTMTKARMAYPRRRRMDTSKYAGANKTAHSKETMGPLWPVLSHIVHTTIVQTQPMMKMKLCIFGGNFDWPCFSHVG